MDMENRWTDVQQGMTDIQCCTAGIDLYSRMDSCTKGMNDSHRKLLIKTIPSEKLPIKETDRTLYTVKQVWIDAGCIDLLKGWKDVLYSIGVDRCRLYRFTKGMERCIVQYRCG